MTINHKIKQKKYSHQHYLKHKDRIKKTVNSYRKRNKEKIKERRRSWYQTPAGKKVMRENNWKRKGIILTVEEYMELLESQGGKCAVCGKFPSPNVALRVDHDHETGKIRGLLCPNCNVGLGMFKENEEILTNAIVYVKEKR